METSDILSPDCTHCAVQGTSKKRILEIISQIASNHLDTVDCGTILNSLLSREKMGSTGIGNGIALPHGRLKGLKEALAVLVTCKPSVPFDALDNQPVDVFFAILVPDEQTDKHLKTLSAIAGKLSDKNIVKLVRAASGDEQLFNAVA